VPREQIFTAINRDAALQQGNELMANEPVVYCMSVTPFAADGTVDQAGLRAHLARMVEAGVAVYLASPGSGEGHSLSREELDLVYRVGVEVCKGRVPVCANPPEARNAEESLARLRLAIDAGVDLVQLYPVDAGHGMRPTEAEQETYYRYLLDRIDHPVGLSVNVLAGGYGAPVSLFKRLCDDYPQIELINVNQPPTSHLSELMSTLGARVAFCTAAEMLPEGLTLGAKGCLTGQANVTPYLIRAIGRHFINGQIENCGRALHDVFRMNRTVGQFGLDRTVQQLWSPRWIKAAMCVLDLPGHGGGRMRPPYRSPSVEEIESLAVALASIDLSGTERRHRATV
jgi:4-hydroxy-tetrahydrodipicolinate synthase